MTWTWMMVTDEESNSKGKILMTAVVKAALTAIAAEMTAVTAVVKAALAVIAAEMAVMTAVVKAALDAIAAEMTMMGVVVDAVQAVIKVLVGVIAVKEVLMGVAVALAVKAAVKATGREAVAESTGAEGRGGAVAKGRGVETAEFTERHRSFKALPASCSL